ncbi:MAG TPA: flagellar hook-associated protein FlgK [Phycisphaerales bacterium]|nr:flagellar hook-associated protein FlgK [Phycisphaerales bacterium]
MSGYEIGISGIHAAQRALTIIGNNIANAATEGYHRQEINLTPAAEAYTNGVMVGQGVRYAGVIRKIDTVLESEILRQESTLSEMERRLEMLSTIESAFGELSTDGLSTAIDQFFASFQDLAIRPEDVNLQSEVLSKAQTLVSRMNNLATMTSNLNEMAYSESVSTVDRINLLAEQIASLNQEIYNQSIRGNVPNNTLDQRDKLITELGRLIGIRTISRDNGMIDIIASEVSIVVGPQVTRLEIGLVNDEQYYQLGLRPTGTDTYDTHVRGGALGGLFELRNTLIRDMDERLDVLAGTIIRETNQLHVQGVGQDGSFTNLTGWTMSRTGVSDVIEPIQAGTFYVRVTDAQGTTIRTGVQIDSDDTFEEVADKLNAVDGISSSFSGGRIHVTADADVTFDFLPGVDSQPVFATEDLGAGTESARPTITLTGRYTGDANRIYTATVETEPPGETSAVGNGTMRLVVQTAEGDEAAILNIGQGYTPGQALELDNGIKIILNINGLSPGFLADGDQFEFQAIADSDPTGFLAAVGLNCFFSGTDANSMDVSDYVKNAGGRIAATRSPEKNGNDNAVLLAQIGDQPFESLGLLSIKDYYRQTAVGLGNQISITRMQYENADGVLRSLRQQREEISGVDINDQAGLMMLYERMFQAMARYVNTINETQKTVLTLTS